MSFWRPRYASNGVEGLQRELLGYWLPLHTSCPLNALQGQHNVLVGQCRPANPNSITPLVLKRIRALRLLKLAPDDLAKDGKLRRVGLLVHFLE